MIDRLLLGYKRIIADVKPPGLLFGLRDTDAGGGHYAFWVYCLARSQLERLLRQIMLI